MEQSVDAAMPLAIASERFWLDPGSLVTAIFVIKLNKEIP